MGSAIWVIGWADTAFKKYIHETSPVRIPMLLIPLFIWKENKSFLLYNQAEVPPILLLQ